MPMLHEIQSRGYGVFLTDGNPDCIGSRYAEQFVNLDTYDIAGHLELAQSMSKKPVAVLTVAADVGPTVSAVAEELELPACDYLVAKRVRNKAEFRKTLNAPHPAFRSFIKDFRMVYTTWERVCDMREAEPYPCVIKPLEKAGSRDIGIINNRRDFNYAVTNFPEREFLIEEYLQSECEIATDNFVLNGNIKFANSVYRKFDRFGIEHFHINPYELNQELRDKIRYVATKFGVDWGPLKVDFIYDKRYGWVITEAATRLSGGFDHMYAAPVATGKDITKFMLDIALGRVPKYSDLWNTLKQYAVTYAPELQPGHVVEYKIPQDYCEEIFITTNDIHPLENCARRPVFYITRGYTVFEAYRKARVVEKEMEIIYESNADR